MWYLSQPSRGTSDYGQPDDDESESPPKGLAVLTIPLAVLLAFFSPLLLLFALIGCLVSEARAAAKEKNANSNPKEGA